MKNGCRMLLDRRVDEQANAARSGEYETSTQEICLRMFPPEGIFFDIGANIGFYTCSLAARAREHGGHVYAFEPVEMNARRLARNIKLNGLEDQVTLTRAALGDHHGVLTMHIEPQGTANNAIGDNMLSPHDRANIAQRGGWKTDQAPLLPLDDWVSQMRLGRCDLIKIDVEGAELHVLRGALELLRRHRPAIVGEFNPYWMKQIGQSFKDAIAFFEPLRYRFFREMDGRYLPLTEALIATDFMVPTYVLLPAEREDLAQGVLDYRMASGPGTSA